MKAIILAAGKGTRLKKYTREVPKGMLEFQGKTLLQHQIDTLKSAGIQDITIVKGFKAETINFRGVKYYTNEDYATTNMVESLLKAKEEFTEDIIVTYSDILFDKELIEKAMISPYDIGVIIDTDWKDYWKERYGVLNYDLESLNLKGDRIISLGEDVSDSENIDGRYVGIVKFSFKGINELLNIENKVENKSMKWMNSNKPFYKIHMTDLLQGFLDLNITINAIKIERGWIEFDTNNDYELMNKWQKDNKLEDFMKSYYFIQGKSRI